jgi:transposase-like protein
MVNTREVAAEYRLTHWGQIMQERMKSGSSIKSYCNEKGICENTYYYWQRRLREAACEELSKYESRQRSDTQPRFIGIEVAEQPGVPALPAPSGYTSQPSQIHIKAAEVEITADSTYPPEQLAALLRELKRPC